MIQPRWMQEHRDDSFWSRHYDLAEIAEAACEQALEAACQQWLDEQLLAEVKHGIRDSKTR